MWFFGDAKELFLTHAEIKNWNAINNKKPWFIKHDYSSTYHWLITREKQHINVD